MKKARKQERERDRERERERDREKVTKRGHTSTNLQSHLVLSRRQVGIERVDAPARIRQMKLENAETSFQC
jgi:hypothetical protein